MSQFVRQRVVQRALGYSMGVACGRGLPSWGMVPPGYTGARLRWTWLHSSGYTSPQRAAITIACDTLHGAASVHWFQHRYAWLDQLFAAPVDVLILDSLPFPRPTNIFWDT